LLLLPTEISKVTSSEKWLSSDLFLQISTEHFKNTDWSVIPDHLLLYLFLHDSPTYGVSRSEATIKEYLRDLLDFLEFTESYGGLRSLSPEDLLTYQDSLSHKYANSTFRKKVTVTKQFLTYLYKRNVLENDLTRLMKRVAQPASSVINRDLYRPEMDLLLEYFKSRNYFIYCLLYILPSTGLRINEIAIAKWNDLFYDHTTGYYFLSVIGKGNKPREILIFDDTLQVIREFRKRRGFSGSINQECDSAFFPKPDGGHYNPKYLSNVFTAKILDTSIVQYRKDRLTPHTCRHFYANLLTSEGANIDAVKDALGHSSIITTQRYLLKQRNRENHAGHKVGRIFNKK